MTETITAIAAEHTITIDWRERTAARAWRKQRKVRLCPITTPERFAVALHEIGHVVGKVGKNRLESEYFAWRWALDHTPIPFDSAAWLHLHRCLRSYVEWAKVRQYRKHGKPVVPSADHPLWSLLNEAKQQF